MAKRALVIGSQTSGLTGVESDAQSVAELLEARGFTVDPRTRARATRQGILDGYDALIEQTREGDAAVVYYSGHGSRVIDSKAASGDALQDIVPFDYLDGTDLDYRGITSTELSIKLRQLVAKSKNATVILDCCHSGQMSRDGAARDATPRALPHPLRVDLAAHLRALEAMYGSDLKALGTAGNVDAVRLVACAQSEVAMEYTNSRGRRTGAFTEALLELFTEIGDSSVTWSVLGQAIRQRVLRRFPAQRPDVEGPVDRQIFSLAEQASSEVVAIARRDGGYQIDAGRIHGVNAGDKYEIARFHAHQPVARAVVTGTNATTAGVEITEWLTGAQLPDDAVAIRVARAAPRRAITVIAPADQQPAIRAAIARAQTLRVAEDGDVDPSIATLRVTGDRLTIEDTDGPLFPAAAYPEALPDAVQNLANLGVARALRELEGAHDVYARELTIEWGVVEDGARRPLPDHGAALGLGDRIYCRIANKSQRRLYAHVFNLGLQGRVALLSSWAPSGITLEPGGETILGEAFDGRLEGLGLSWPNGLPKATFPRLDTLFVIATSVPANLGVLQTVRVEMRGATRSKGSGLAQLLEQLQTGGTREVGGPEAIEGYLARALTFLLHPREGRMTSPEFLIDDAPGSRGAARAPEAWRPPQPTPSRTIAIRLSELAIEDTHAWFATDVRVDALICTRPGEDEPGYRPQTMRFSRVRSGDQAPIHNALLYHGPARDFVDICLWVSRDVSGSLALTELIAKRATSPEVKDALGALLVAAGVAAAPWVTAVGASAVLARVAYEAIVAASGTSIGLYRTSFLASEDYGIGRYPRLGRYRAQDFSFALQIDAT